MSKSQTAPQVWEVFLQEQNGAPHVHAGNVHAPDAELALQCARDVFARRGQLFSVWVVPSEAIHQSRPEDMASFFEANSHEALRSPQNYKVPREVKDK